MSLHSDRENIEQCYKLSLPLHAAFAREPLHNTQLHPEMGLI